MTPHDDDSEFVWRGDRAYHLGVPRGALPRRVIAVGDPARADRVAARFDRITARFQHREYVTVCGEVGGVAIAALGTGIGTDNTEIAVVEAAALWRADPGAGGRPAIVRVGTSGGAQPDVEPGVLAIAAYAIGLDSTSVYYGAPPADAVVVELEAEAARAIATATTTGARFAGRTPVYASRACPGLTAALAGSASRRGVAHEVGVTVSAPGFYGASGRRIAGLSCTVPAIKAALAAVATGGLRVINFEMEASALFHLAAPLGIDAAALCAIVSRPGSHARVVDPERAIDDAIAIAVEVCTSPLPTGGRPAE